MDAPREIPMVADWAEAEEVELPPTEVANANGGNAQSAGQQPTLTFARANDKDHVRPATYKQKGRTVDGELVATVAVQRYCHRCYIGLPTAAKGQCPSCGAPLKKT